MDLRRYWDVVTPRFCIRFRSSRGCVEGNPSVGLCVGTIFGETGAMLVLSRKKNESIVIDENIVITVVEVRGDKVRLGIQAPREVPIHRSEVHEAIRAEQKAAAEGEPPRVSPSEA